MSARARCFKCKLPMKRGTACAEGTCLWSSQSVGMSRVHQVTPQPCWWTHHINRRHKFRPMAVLVGSYHQNAKLSLAALPFSKSNNIFFGYFDPENIFSDDEDNHLPGWPNRCFGYKRSPALWTTDRCRFRNRLYSDSPSWSVESMQWRCLVVVRSIRAWLG